MRLPTLSVIVGSQAIIWCLAGAYVRGPMILLYPLSWLAIGAVFFLHNKKNPINLPPQAVPSDGSWANSQKPAKGVETDANVESSTVATE